MSRSIFTRASSARSLAISICSGLTGFVLAPTIRPSLSALTHRFESAQRHAGGNRRLQDLGGLKHQGRAGRHRGPAYAPALRLSSADAAAEIPPIPPGLYVHAGLEAVNGNEVLYRRLLSMFREREASFESSVREACARGDLASALRRAHDLKSVAGTLGMPALQQAAAALEAAFDHDTSMAAIDPLIDAVSRQLTPLLSSLPRLHRK